LPVESIVPMLAEPPLVPLTDQVTAVFELPVTVAVNANELPARIFAVVGETLTATAPGVDGCEGLGLLGDEEAAVPEQPPSTTTKIGNVRVTNALASRSRSIDIAVAHTSKA